MLRASSALLAIKTAALPMIFALLTGCASAPTPFESTAGGWAPYGLLAKYSTLPRFDQLPPLLENQLNYPPKPLHEKGLLTENSELAAVKYLLDTHFIHMSDERLYFQKEDWRAPIDLMQQGDNLFGDCEDYALAARAMLLKRGIKSRLIYARTGNGVGHVITEVDGWVIDNRMSRIATRADLLGYQFFTMSEPNLGFNWRTVKADDGRQSNTQLALRN
ncbi:transglutaminase-like cysteine peptidase [Geopseudomonas aromaticivorans]